jgi:hypothetical protein
LHGFKSVSGFVQAIADGNLPLELQATSEQRLCRKNELRTGDPSQSLFVIGQFQKVETPALLMLGYRLCQRLELALYESCSLPQVPSKFVVPYY